MRHKLILFALIVLGTFGVYLAMSPRKDVIPQNLPLVTPTMTPSPDSTVTVEAPDTTRTLVMRERIDGDNVTHVFLTSDSGTQLKEIFEKSLPKSVSLSIPFNTFSPDNKYVFLKEGTDASAKYYVLSTTDGLLTKDGQPIELTAAFAAKHPNYKVSDVTGWGGIGLIVINTDKLDGTPGPSFWFDVHSKGFIQLANRFN